MRRITVQAAKELRAVPGVHSFGAHIGRAEAADEVVGANFTELWIALDEDVDYESTIAQVQKIVDGYPGLAARPVDLPARAGQGSAHRRERHHRRPNLRSRPRPADGAGRRTLLARSERSTAWRTSRCRRRCSCRRSRCDTVLRKRSSSACRRRTCAARRRRSCRARRSGRSTRTRKCSTSWCGEARRCATACPRSARSGCRRRAAASSRSARRPTSLSRRRPTRLRASGDRGAST